MMRKQVSLLLLVCVALLGCPKDKTVKFGAVLPLTGEAGIYGQSIQRGVELAFEELKNSPETGFTLEYSIVDSAGDPDQATELLGQQLRDGALAVIGGVTSREALQMVPVAERSNRVLLSPTASSPELTAISRNFYRIWPSDFLEGTKMGNAARQTLKLKTMVVLAKIEPHAKAIQGVFKTEFERHGGEVLDVLEVPPGPTDLSGVMARVKDLAPDGIYLSGFAADISAMIVALREIDFAGRILTTHAFASPETIAELGSKVHNVYLTMTAFAANGEEAHVEAFFAAFEARFGALPDIYAAHGYDAAKVLAAAYDADVLPSDFYRSLRAVRDFPGVAGTFQFDEKGDVQKFPRVYLIDKNGELRDYDAYMKERKDIIRQKKAELERKMREARRRNSG